MKVLYIANERRSAVLAVSALRDFVPELALTWAGHLSVALRWIHDNRDLGALVVEAEIQNQHCASFVSQVRSLGLTAPVIVVVPEEGEPPLAALKAGADHYVARQSLLADLPAIVSRAVHRVQGTRSPAHTAGGKGQADRRMTPTLPQSAVNRLPYLVRLAQDGRILDVSTGGLAAFGGAARRAVVGSSIYIHLAEHQRDAMRNLIGNACPDAATSDVEFQVVAPDGSGRCALRARTTQLTQGEEGPSILFVFDDVTERWGQTARADRDALEAQLVAAKAHSERVEREYAAARQDWENARDHFQAAAAAEATSREALEQQMRDARASASETERRFNIAAEFLREGKTVFRAAIDQEKAKRESLEQNLADAQAALKEAEQRHACHMTTTAAQVAELQAQYDAELAQSAAARRTLAQQLRDAEGAHDRARADWAADAAAAAEHVTRLEAELAASQAETTTAQRALELRLGEAQIALQQTEERVAVEQLAVARAAQLQGELEVRLAQEIANRDVLAQQLRDAEGAHDRARADWAADAAAAAEHVTRLEAELAASQAETTATQRALELRLGEAQIALQQTEERVAVEQLAVARAAQLQGELEIRLAQEVANRDVLAQQLRDAEGAHDRARADWAADAAAAAERLTRREAEVAASLAEATTTQRALELRLGEAQIALQQTEERVAVEQLAVARAAQLQGELEIRLAQGVATRDVLAQQLRDAEGALAQAKADSAAGAAAAAEHVTRLEAELAASQAETSATQRALELRLGEAQIALHQTEERVAVEQLAVARAAQLQGELEIRLAQEVTTRDLLAQQLRDAEGAHDRARADWATDVAAAAEHVTRLEAELAASQAETTATRHALELRLADAEAALQHTEERVSVEQLAVARASQLQGELEIRLAQEVLNRENVERELAQARVTGESAERCFVEEVAGVWQRTREHEALLEERFALERVEHEGIRAGMQEEIRLLQLETQRTLEQVQAEFEQALERASSERAAERARLETQVTERDTQLAEQSVRHSTSQRAAQNQLDESRAENRRQFEQTPYGICRCGRDGALTDVNHALVALLRYRTAEELRAVDFATSVFEARDELRLLIERCVSKGTMEAIETTWRRKDRSRVVVRLFALHAASDSIEIVAMDISNVRGLEERLRQVQPIEAVGRLAMEVARTCDNVLRDVSDDAQQWLATIDSDTVFRHEGERLLHEVTRAAGFLRQLAVSGRKQATVNEPIDVNRVLRDLAPVLKRVAGEDIEFVMPKTSSPVHVDVEAERVERVFVNVASFGRERMPFGGQLLIELDTVVVGSKFVAKYPNVRPGDHALITVTELRGGFRSDLPVNSRKGRAGANTLRSASDSPGVDLGVLQGLIGECGGHLWIKADSTGDMVLKMHLPQPVLDGPAEPPSGGSERGRPIARWFRH